MFEEKNSNLKSNKEYICIRLSRFEKVFGSKLFSGPLGWEEWPKKIFWPFGQFCDLPGQKTENFGQLKPIFEGPGRSQF